MAAPINDLMVNATAINGSSGSVSGTMVEATAETKGGSKTLGTGSVWYRWTGPADVSAIRFTKSGLFIAIFEPLVPAPVNLTDLRMMAMGSGEAMAEVIPGREYWVAVGWTVVNSSVTTFTLSWSGDVAPGGALGCRRLDQAHVLVGQVDFHSSHYGDVLVELVGVEQTIHNPTWFKYKSNVTSSVTFDTFVTSVSGTDSAMAIFSSSIAHPVDPYFDLVALAYNDDAGTGGSANDSAVTVGLTRGDVVYIAVGTYSRTPGEVQALHASAGGATARFRLRWQIPFANGGSPINKMIAHVTGLDGEVTKVEIVPSSPGDSQSLVIAQQGLAYVTARNALGESQPSNEQDLHGHEPYTWDLDP